MLNRAIFERIEVLATGDAQGVDVSGKLTEVCLKLTEAAAVLKTAREIENPDPLLFGPGFALEQTGGEGGIRTLDGAINPILA